MREFTLELRLGFFLIPVEVAYKSDLHDGSVSEVKIQSIHPTAFVTAGKQRKSFNLPLCNHNASEAAMIRELHDLDSVVDQIWEAAERHNADHAARRNEDAEAAGERRFELATGR